MSKQSSRRRRHKRRTTKIQRERRRREKCVQDVKAGKLPLCVPKVRTYHGSDYLWGLFGEEGVYVEVPPKEAYDRGELKQGVLKAWWHDNQRQVYLRKASEDEVFARAEMANRSIDWYHVDIKPYSTTARHFYDLHELTAKMLAKAAESAKVSAS